jgi:hypothetical protein
MGDYCNSCKNTYWIDSSEQCPKCGGGCFDRSAMAPCVRCKGKGILEMRVPCPVCNPKGEKPDKRMIIR